MALVRGNTHLVLASSKLVLQKKFGQYVNVQVFSQIEARCISKDTAQAQPSGTSLSSS